MPNGRAYNDLRFEAYLCPRLLVVLHMPAEEARWEGQTSDELILRHCAYWISLKGHAPTTAANSVRVAIPLENIFSVDQVVRLMQRAAERTDL